jgi:hypothetical protein
MTYINRRFGSLGQGASLNRVAPLDDDELHKLAPSIFAPAKHDSRSDRYTYIPTAEIVAGMRANGFVPTWATQGKSRVEGKEAYTKHMIRFRQDGQQVTARRIGGLYPEVVIVNSHDGTSAYKVMAGLLRLVCLNGMLTADRELASVTVPHKGDIIGKVIEGSYEVIGQSRVAIEQADTWAGVPLTRDERQMMAEAAHIVRFGDAEGNVSSAIKPDQLLLPRRAEDRETSLWNTMNVIQENAIRGGLSGRAFDANNRPRRTTTRPVTGIDADVKINRALWLLTERMAALKAAA